ncbi:hypothetical protein FD755_014827, partial [Muntiacus reevesi]
TILTHWKNGFDLWSDGHLIYYNDQTADSKRLYAADCFCRDGKTISLCAESTDDYLAWKFTLQDSRTNTAYVGSEVMYDETAVASSPPPYTDYAAPTPEQAYGYGPYSGDFMDSSLPTKSSFVSGIETMTVTWRWACWLEQPQAWP